MTQIDRINGLIGSIAVKAPCKAATTANITLSGAQTIDGVSLTSGDRCLVKNQTTASENGIYDVSSTAWSRAIDFNGRRDIVQGTAVRIISGTVSGQYFYEVTTADPIIGNTDIAFALVNFPVTTTPFMATLLDDETAAEALTTLGGANLTAAANTFTGTIIAANILMGKTFVHEIGSDAASATALALGDGNIFDITGTTTITSIAAKSAGAIVVLQFDDILILTHHATDLILPGKANITTAAGDIGVFYEYATGDWRCVSYTRANVSPIQNFRGALVTGATQSISYSADEAIAFSSETYDTDSIHDNATNNTRLTVPSGVTKVKLKCYTAFATNGTGTRRLRIDKNGSPLSYGGVTGIENSPSASNVSVVSAFTAVLEVTSGEYFEAVAYQTETGLGNLNATGSWFSMEIIE